jgi:LacI family transcriptional regulator
MATIKDISRLANVSTASVSKVVNGDYKSVSESTRDKILQIAKELNYKPNRLARSLVTNQTNILGLIVTDITNPYFSSLAKGVEDRAGSCGYNVILCNTDDNQAKEATYIDVLLEYNVAGVIITGMANPDSSQIQDIVKSKIPLVSIDRYVSPDTISVFLDSFRGTYLSTEYLIKKGHKKIAFISGDAALKLPNQRLNGYLQALRDYNMEEDKSIIKLGTYHMENGYETARSFLDNHADFTSIVCGNDLIAFGAIKAIKERGLSVPGDISVIGFDDIYLSSIFEPALTTIRQPIYDIGSYAVDVMIRLVKNEAVNQKIKYFGPEIIERDSVRNL